MVTYQNNEDQKLAQADRLVRKKVTALGYVKSDLEEPFFDFRTIPETQIMNVEPPLNDFVSPEYVDKADGEGAVGTRYGVLSGGALDAVRLHSYVPSGKDGANSCQTFFIINPDLASPANHDTAELESKRMYPLIGPEFSTGRTHAFESVTSSRGFQLALYPAKTTGGVGTALTFDDTYGPIPISADPSGANGAGDNGFWYVDYDNGVVRLSEPMLHGSDGVFNPNDVYGDIDGNEVAGTDNNAAPQLFAVFYRYTGDFGFDNNSFITIGDGTNSEGMYNGATQTTIQAAIDSLPDIGGAIFIKPGVYSYSQSVVVRGNTGIFGLGGVQITRPSAEPAFLINSEIRGGYSGKQSLEGLTILSNTASDSGGAIELRNNSDLEDINGVVIKDCVLDAQDNAPAIGLAPTNGESCTYSSLKIQDNVFNRTGTGTTVHIGVTTSTGLINIPNARITGNDFQLDDVTSTNAIEFNSSVGVIDGIVINNNNIKNSGIIISTLGSIAFIYDFNLTNSRLGFFTTTKNFNSAIITNNIISGAFSFASLGASTISNNQTGDFSFTSMSGGTNVTSNNFGAISSTNLINSVVIANNVSSGGFDISGNWASCKFISNTFGGAVSGASVSDTIIDSNSIGGNLSFSGGSFVSTKCTANTITGQMSAGDTSNSIVAKNNLTSGMILGACSGTNILDNTLGSTLLISSLTGSNVIANTTTSISCNSSVITNSYVTNNIVSAAITLHSLSSSYVLSNQSTNITISNQIDSSGVSQNKITGNLNITGTSNDSGVIGNVGGADFLIGGEVSNTIISKNIFGNATLASTSVNGENGAQNSFFENNSITGDFLIGSAGSVTSTNTNISGNTISGTAAFKILAGSIMESNNITGNVSFTNITQSSIVSENFMGACSVDIITDSIFRSNISTANISAVGNLTSSQFSDNVFTSAAFVNVSESNVSNNNLGGDFSASGYFRDSSFTNNNMDSNNFSVGSDIQRSIFSANRIGDATLVSVSDSIFSDNDISGVCSISTGGVTDSILSENRFSSGTAAHNFGTVTGSIINDNLFSNISGSLTANGLSGVMFSGNDVDGDFNSSGNLANTTIDGNKIGGAASTLGNLDGVFFTSNELAGSTRFTVGNVDSSSIMGNSFASGAGDFTTGWFRTSVFSENTLNDVEFGSIGDESVADKGSIIANNIMTDLTIVGPIIDSSLCGNFIKEIMDIGASINYSMLRSRFNSNCVVSTITTKHFPFDTVSISDNYVGYATWRGGFISSVFSNNVFASIVNFNSTEESSANSTINKSIVSNNLFQQNVSITNSVTTGDRSVIKDSVITNNIIDGEVYIASNGALNVDTPSEVLLNSSFSYNKISGDFIASGNTDSNAEAVFVESYINGNTVGGTTNFGNENGDKDLFKNSSVKDNVFTGGVSVGVIGYGQVSPGLVFVKSNFSNNTLQSTLTTGNNTRNGYQLTYDDFVFSNNVVYGDVNIRGKIRNSSIVHNKLRILAGGSINFNQVSNSSVLGNEFKNTTVFSQTASSGVATRLIDYSDISNNIFGATLEINNDFSTDSDPAMIYSKFNNNIVSGAANFISDREIGIYKACIEKSMICNNCFESTFGISGGANGASALEAIISDNLFNDNVSLYPENTRVSFVGNRVSGNMSLSLIIDSIFIANDVSGTASGTYAAIEKGFNHIGTDSINPVS